VTVRFRPVYSAACVLLGLFDLVLGFFAVRGDLTGGGPASTSTVFCFVSFAFVTLICAVQWSRTYFEFEATTRTIAVKRAFGAGRRFGGADGDRLVVDGDRVFCITASGARKRVPVARFLACAEQWNAVLEQIRRTSFTGPASW
jgi:hypothetical protein